MKPKTKAAAKTPRTMPFVAVLTDGDLEVTLFEDPRAAKAMFHALEDRHRDSATFESRCTGSAHVFSVDKDEGPSVMLGRAFIVRKDPQ